MWETKISIDYETDKARQEQEQEGARIRHIDRINGGEAVFFSFLLLGSSEVVIKKMKARIQGDRQPGRYAERFSDDFGLASFFMELGVQFTTHVINCNKPFWGIRPWAPVSSKNRKLTELESR